MRYLNNKEKIVCCINIFINTSSCLTLINVNNLIIEDIVKSCLLNLSCSTIINLYAIFYMSNNEKNRLMWLPALTTCIMVNSILYYLYM